jgi:hypothetical protein
MFIAGIGEWRSAADSERETSVYCQFNELWPKVTKIGLRRAEGPVEYQNPDLI